MKMNNVKAVMLQELYVTRSSMETIFDVFVFSLSSIVVFGFLSKYLSGSSNTVHGENIFLAVIFWEVIRITQYSTSVSSLCNVWSHNLSNVFIAPIKLTEYLTAHILSAIIKASFMFLTACVLANYIFHLNILSLGLFPVVFTFINMVIFAVAVGLVLVGAVFQFGTKVQALTWGTIFIIQPFCAVFFPVQILPPFLQVVAHCFPVSYFFEWVRALHTGTTFNSSIIWGAFAFNLVYLAFGFLIFSKQVAASKRSGQLVRNDL